MNEENIKNMKQGEIINRPNILLVEDDHGLAYATAYALQNEKFSVTVGGSIREAKEKLKEDQFDLILLDVGLPDGTGYEFCEKIRENSDIPIIFFTACDEEVNIVMGLDIGGDDYITKPFRVKELVSRLNAVLRRKGTMKGQAFVLISGDIKVYQMECRVFIKEEEIILTSMEYKLLLTFMENSFHILSRSALLETLWNIDSKFVDDNTLSVYIRRLREKLEPNCDELCYIATVRGIGYKWNQTVGRGKIENNYTQF